jgi:ankyrin repeat protein
MPGMQRANVIQPTYYDILEVANDATAAEIFHAYGIKAKKAHPKNNAADTAALFAQINAAYAHLVDFSTRMDYDASIGLISQHAILQNEKFKLDDLPALLRLNRLDEIRAIIQDVKAVDKMKWQDKDIVKHTVMDAVISGNMAALELFLAEGFVPNCSVDLNPTRKGRVKPIVYFAAITNNLPMVKLMLECCYSIDKDTYHTDMNRDSALKAAVKKDNYDMVEYLLAKGASADNHFGNSMRMEPYVARAARYADHRMIALLLKHAEIFDIESALRHNRDNSKKAIQNYSYALQNECHESTRKRLIEHCKQVNHSGHAYSVKELAELEEKMVLYPKKIACLQAYQHSVIINLMDHAVATDFTYCRDELEYFKEMDSIAGINFIGVSVDGKPVTRQYLMELGCKDCNQAIITMDDLARLPEPRRTLIQNQVDALLHPQSRMKYGLLIKDGVINLVSIWNAAAAGDLEAVATRLAAGAKPDGYAILNAARHGHAEVALLLRNHPDFDIKTLAAAINEARKAGHTDLVKILSATQDVNQPDEYGNILLQHAANKGDVQEVRSLIARGADVNYSGGKMGYPVSIAAAPIKYSDNAGSMTGYRHPTEGHTEILKILLAHGANPNVCIYGDTPMQAAGKAGSLEGLKILLPITEKTPARVYSTDNEDRAQYLMLPWYTKIMFAAQDSQNFLDILKLILAEGADFNQDDENGSHLFTNMINKFNHHDWLTVSETTFKERARADLQSWKVVDSRDDQTSVNKKKYSQR